MSLMSTSGGWKSISERRGARVILIIAAIVAAVLVAGIAVLELVGWMDERNARKRFEKMTPEERFKYQSETRKAEI